MRIIHIALSLLSFVATSQAGEPFTDEASILAISREDQANDLKIKRLRQEITLPMAIKVLTTYTKVTKEQYFRYAHQSGAHGKITLKGDKEFSWEIELDYAATVKNAEGKITYLLLPKLAAKLEGDKD